MRTILLLALLIGVFGLNSASFASEKWPGVDEAVVEKVASEHGRASCPPLIDTDQGDLLLFAFLLAGAVAGFAGGYYWRMLVAERKER